MSGGISRVSSSRSRVFSSTPRRSFDPSPRTVSGRSSGHISEFTTPQCVSPWMPLIGQKLTPIVFPIRTRFVSSGPGYGYRILSPLSGHRDHYQCLLEEVASELNVPRRDRSYREWSNER